MPIPKNPNIPEFYVYQFSANDLPFYIGIGRSKRADDRIRYVKSVIKRRRNGLYVKPKAKSVLLMEELLNRNIEINLKYLYKNITRHEALIKEKEVIESLTLKGYRLINFAGNPNKESNIDDFIDYLISNK